MAKDLEYYLAQARRIAEHREANAEKEIRKLYKATLKDLQQFMSQTYVQYAEDDKLTFAMLQKAGYDARFLEEIEQRLNLSTPKAAAELRKLVEETYKAAYDGMAQGVLKASDGSLSDIFEGAIAITPEQIKAAVENPVSGLTLTDTLEKNRKEIIYNIKQVVGVGLMNGDRYTTMAKRIAEHVDGDYRKAIRIARTEAHRVREAGNIDAAVKVDAEMQKGKTGMRMVKVWRSMKDERVRPQRSWKTKKGWKRSMGSGPENHIKLDGQTVLASEPFDMGHSGLKAMAPGQSGNAGDDINCRCYASYEMMTDAAYYAKTGKHFPGYESVSGIKRAPFKSAESMSDAKTYAEKYARQVDYGQDEATLRFFNHFNESLNTLEQEYPAAKLNKIWVNRRLKNSGMRANCDEIEINPKAIRGDKYTMADWAAYKKRASARVEEYRKKGLEKEAKKLEKELKYKRWDVCSSYEKEGDYIFSLVAHEYGHVISDQYIGLINGTYGIKHSYRLRDIGKGSPKEIADGMTQKVKAAFSKAKKNGDIYDISCYAATDKDEFFSEVFAMHACGEKLPDYIEEMLEEVLKIGKL